MKEALERILTITQEMDLLCEFILERADSTRNRYGLPEDSKEDTQKIYILASMCAERLKNLSGLLNQELKEIECNE